MYYYDLSPRYSETDAMGHINNTVLPVWFEKARDPIFELFMPGRDLSKANLITVKYEIEFSNEIRYENDVQISTGIKKIGNSSLTVVQRLVQNDVLCAIGQTTIVHFDYKTKKPGPIPETIRQQLEAHILSLKSPRI
ncbi:acyl-CoA thioesterase (plasmid) [Photobacterium sp. GJ3]|uniref:acyl-CoA thioesterase n=1 Tax=Photobacterium sp. GJ3 TaxID=2829502 RepID=UPI001B8CF4DE|nr:thioesterase family protein [Photobacterium sp. GJ3]QUJ69459.1 acyl-CoA thioesterase [Photobacterium sp. GJ3]